MKYIEVHMPLEDFQLLFDSGDTSQWEVFGVYDYEITKEMSYLYKQIKILKSNEKETIKSKSDKGSS